mmetsp:Transcript_84840/g.124155  ORF Transcript_84840/g.124155 Transcript_84840/m.124155 type:complete len:222 (-) Transcript_84840:367-1032(-)|eukprot:CAMPEP_0173131230 /NCGR_PEP_ID=MMETSP1102-20130122/60513_1 /TAXON_ID=49646 /ORGANISM="Geminigera sp., Strain Caron Lab Isolate" /LENGTH=221 /DNA_ID=CAMNT_0014042499 /DNA_START=1363 /DNA_END=2028 /DNA_ORIENTATION=-
MWSFRHLGGGSKKRMPCKHLVFNATLARTQLIGTSHYLEEALVPPSGSPTVGAQPILCRLLPPVLRRLHAPAHDFDGMSSLNNVQKLLVVNAGRIAHEARVDTEPSLDRTVRKNLLHDIVLALDLEEIRRLVLLERDRGINAGSAAGGRRAAAGTVGETSVGDDASVAKILPRMVQVAPVAALVARVAAHHVFRGHDMVDFAHRGKGEPISKHLAGGECPA